MDFIVVADLQDRFSVNESEAERLRMQDVTVATDRYEDISRSERRFHRIDFSKRYGSRFTAILMSSQVNDQRILREYLDKNRRYDLTFSSNYKWNEHLDSDFRVQGGSISPTAYVRGSYAAVRLFRGSDILAAWSTVPNVEAIYYAEHASRIYISNRPLLVASALDSVRYSEGFLEQYLTYGYAIDDNSPFLGVSKLDQDKALVVKGGTYFITTSPLVSPTLPGDIDYEDPSGYKKAGERLAELLVDSCRTLYADETEVQLRMSGGIDSRFLAAGLNAAGVSFRGVTFGRKKDPDVTAAYEVSNALGFPLDVTQPALNNFTSLRRSSIETIQKSGGYPLAEAHQLPYAPIGTWYQAENVTFGQWPLYKGGMARNLRYSTAGIERILGSQISPYVSPALVSAGQMRLEKWRTGRLESVPAEILYLFGRDVRSGNWTRSNYLLYSSVLSIDFPISDISITSLCDSVPYAWKVSQRMIHHALRTLSEPLVKLPLAGSRWRFESVGSEVPTPQGQPTSWNQGINKLLIEPPENTRFYGDIFKEITHSLIASQEFEFLANYLEPKVKKYFLNASNSDRLGLEKSSDSLNGNYNDPQFKRFIWRLYAAQIFMSKAWYTE